MKIVAAPGARLAVFVGPGRLIRHRVITEQGLYDAKMKEIVAPFCEVPETDYYRKAVANGTAIVVTDKPPAAPKRTGRVEE
jgi:hypothetical protein